MANITRRFGDIEITVQRLTNRGRLLRDRILVAMGDEGDLPEKISRSNFIMLCIGTANVSGVSIVLPNIGSSTDEIKQAYEDFLDLDGLLTEQWVGMVDTINKPLDEVIGPDPLPEDAPKN